MSEDLIYKKIRGLMMDWEGNFPYPEPEDAGYEADVTYNTAQEIVEYIKIHTAQAVKDAQLELLGRLEEQKVLFYVDDSVYPKATLGIDLSVITAERAKLEQELNGGKG